MQILDEIQIKQKTKRIAIQILENNIGEDEIILAGINNNGMYFAKSIGYYLVRLTSQKVSYANIKLNPKNPIDSEININMTYNQLVNKRIIIVDDVANTGRTLFYAFKPFMEMPIQKLEIAVLINRTHKSYPIQPNYIGLSLATTVQENIEVHLRNVDKKIVILN